jgi:ABC-2 type transport system permease protein
VSLYRAETRRLAKRRFTRFFLAGVLVVLAAVAVGVFLSNHKSGPALIATAQARADQDFRQQSQAAAQEKANCEAARGTANAGNYPSDCSQLYSPSREDFRAESYLPASFDLRKDFRDMVTVLAALLAMAAFVVGASFVGAEWTSGGMMNLLLWRPQRLKVLGAKLAALLVGLTAVTVLLSAAWTGVFVLVARLHGTTAGMTSGTWQSIVLMELRGLALVLAGGVVGFGLASIGRHTAMALGVAMGVIVVLQIGLATVLNLAGVKFLEAYLIPTWGLAWMNKSTELQNYETCNFSATNGCQPDTLTLTWQMAGGGLVAILVLIVAASMWTMRSRDVT